MSSSSFSSFCSLSSSPDGRAAYRPAYFSQLFTKRLGKSKYVELFRTQKITLEADETLLIHYGGEPRQLNTNQLTVSIVPGEIRLVY